MDDSKLSTLREILLNLDDDELIKLKGLLNDPNDLALEIAKVLPDAFLFSLQENEKLTATLVPMIESVIVKSVSRNPKMLADALYPVIGRSIRKAINEEFKKLINTFNELIENTFTYRSLKWRYQALISGRKYSEVVISNTLKYQAEHVFLIHRETGILLSEAHCEMSQYADPDAISGMLKAITDFVHDSFEDTGDRDLNLIEMEDYQVLIEQGPGAIIASLVKGFTLENYRDVLNETIIQIHENYASALKNFTGNTFIFEPAAELLQRCLITEKKEQFESRKPNVALIILVPAILLLMFFAGRSFYFNRQWKAYLHEISLYENMVLTHTEKVGKNFTVSGMLMPGTLHPDSILKAFNFPQKHFRSNWQLFLPVDEKLFVSYVQTNIDLPESLNLSRKNDTIVLEGGTSEEWLEQFRTFAKKQLPWMAIETGNLEIVNLIALEERVDRINALKLYFDLGATKLDSVSEFMLREWTQEIEDVFRLAQIAGKMPGIALNGFADSLGDSLLNLTISEKRASYIARVLMQETNIDTSAFKAHGYGVLKTNSTLSDNEKRRVNLEIKLNQEQ